MDEVFSTRSADEAEARAALGESSLESGNLELAFARFGEALRLDPHSERAKQGVLRCLESRHPRLRPLLRYTIWLSRRAAPVRGGIVIGGYLVLRLASGYLGRNPTLQKWAYPLVGLLLVFVFVHFAADSLFHWLLYRDPTGRQVLTDRQVRDVHLVGVFFLFVVALPVGFLAALFGKTGLLVAGVSYLVLPLVVLLKIPPERSRLVPSLVLGVSCVLFCAVASVEASRAPSADHPQPGVGSFVFAVLLSVATMVLANRARFPIRPRS
jgi:hypothetical protein